MKKHKCRACNADFRKQFVKANYVYGSRGVHKFWQCKECGLVYLYPIPSKKKEDEFYALEFEKFMEKRSSKDRDWSGPEVHRMTHQDQVKRRWKFLKHELKSGNNILEIGCSSGFMLDSFKEAGLNTIGIEHLGKFYNYLAKRGYTCFRSIKEMLQNMPNIKFDFVVHFFVLEHIRDTKGFIEKQLRLLKPGGKIIAEVPCVNDPLTSFYKIPAFEKFYWSIAHHYYFSPDSLSQILDKINCQYKFVPEQRYDLSNHLVWMQEGKPGGQGKYNSIFSDRTLKSYAQDLKDKWLCDTFFLYITKPK